MRSLHRFAYLSAKRIKCRKLSQVNDFTKKINRTKKKFDMYSLPSCLLRVLRSSIAVAASRPASRAHISLSNPSNLQHHPFSSSATTTASTNKPGSPGFRSNVLRTADMKPKYGKQGVADSDKLATDLDSLNLLGDIPPPTTAVDTCLNAGFHLNNGLKITDAGCLLVNGEVFTWRPWECQDGGVMLNRKGQFDVSEEAWGLLRVLWPKPGE